MNLMMLLNMSLWAYGMGVWPCYLASVIYISALIMFMGMRELAVALSDPFGDDAVDFPTRTWFEETLVYCNELLECDYEMTLASVLQMEDGSHLHESHEVEMSVSVGRRGSD